MKILKLLILTFCITAMMASPASAESSEAKAKALAEKAAALIKKDPESAFVTLQKKSSGFGEDGFQIFVLDGMGIYKVHNDRPAVVGKDGTDMVDANGFYFVAAFMDAKDGEWINYKLPNKKDKNDRNKIRDKSVYIKKVGDYTLGVGYFK